MSDEKQGRPSGYEGMDGEEAMLRAIGTLDEELYEKYTSGEIPLAQFLEMKKLVADWARRGAEIVGWVS